MRIACLQFAPQVGDTDNNLNRADAVLAKADPDDIDTLDLIVLPELAFSGWNFHSFQEIAPYVEPSGSGISSLWARTVALKHNTHVLVGYPEKVDVSGHYQPGPEFYNSAILVNGDGETVANYRKTFLYRLDETWAHEGKGFFGRHVPGLGNAAIGICSDINPYRLQAPWHAFEFAFHILEVRANLVIVTMAWITGEECEQFTQFPHEPDMDALTYWAQRLEPVIRDESRDEVIIVFCNRTGIEGDAVYSGTSAVIGIHQGEVKVYGLLGRGVKDLLIVDTDDPPFANLTMRKKKSYLSPSQHDLEVDPEADDRDELLLTPLPTDPDDQTPNKYLPQVPAPPMDQQSSRRDHTSTPTRSSNSKTPVVENTDRSMPTASSPTPQSPRPQTSLPNSRLVRDRLDGIVSESSRDPEGSAALVVDDHQRKDPFRQRSRTLSTTPDLPGPAPMRPLPETPSRSGQGSETARQGPGESERTHTSDATDEARPARPSSPKSRNASRTGLRTWRRCDAGLPDRELYETGHRRAQSAVPQARDCVTTPLDNRPGSSRLRSTSLSGRYPGLDDDFLERALDFYLRAIPRGIKDECVAPETRACRPDARADGRGLLHARTRSLSRCCGHCSRTGPGDRTTPNHANTSTAEEPQIWEQISKVIGEHMQKTQPRESSRGRRRSRSISSTEARLGSYDTTPSSSHTRSTDGRGRSHSGDPSRFRQDSHSRSTVPRMVSSVTMQRDDVPIRSVRDPTLGPPLDPDDEIVAEIIFRRPCCTTCDDRPDSAQAPGAQAQATDKSTSQGTVDHSQDLDSERSTVKRSTSPTDDSEKTPTANRHASSKQEMVLLALQTSDQDLGELGAPNLSAASTHTLSSYEASPVTPPPRDFDPRTPKPLFLGSDCASPLPLGPEPLFASRAEPGIDLDKSSA